MIDARLSSCCGFLVCSSCSVGLKPKFMYPSAARWATAASPAPSAFWSRSAVSWGVLLCARASVTWILRASSSWPRASIWLDSLFAAAIVACRLVGVPAGSALPIPADNAKLASVPAQARTAARPHARRAPLRIPRESALPYLPWGKNSTWSLLSPRPPTGLADGFGPEQPYGGSWSPGRPCPADSPRGGWVPGSPEHVSACQEL